MPLSKRAKFLKSEAGKQTLTLDKFMNYEKAGFVKICCLQPPIHEATPEECRECDFKGTWCISIIIPREKWQKAKKPKSGEILDGKEDKMS